jgi:hypothetical protein
VDEIELAEKNGGARTIFCLPPGSAKSTYLSKLFPPYFLRKPNRVILGASYKKELIEGFGNDSRNLVDLHSKVLGYTLDPKRRASGDWYTSNGGHYFCAGTDGGVAGYRADLAFIDDPIGKDQDAKSESFREKLWLWFWNDFIPRLKPNGSVFILANRRHEDDLVGRLISRYPADWKLIKVPLIVETPEQAASDPLGRKIGDYLWPEYFDAKKLEDARRSPDFSGLHQQDPTPASGGHIKEEWLVPYHSVDDLPTNLKNYVGSDHALTTREENDRNCLIPAGVDERGDIWVYPDVYWEQCLTNKLVDEILNMAKRRQPINWWAESEHIEKAIRPFLHQRMMDEKVFFVMTPLNSSKDLAARSVSICGMMQMHKVHFPVFAHWWPQAKDEMLRFPLGKHDDFLAALSELGRGLTDMARPTPPRAEVDAIAQLNANKFRPTFGWLKEMAKRQESAATRPKYGDR